jgi:hypothetical protein
MRLLVYAHVHFERERYRVASSTLAPCALVYSLIVSNTILFSACPVDAKATHQLPHSGRASIQAASAQL